MKKDFLSKELIKQIEKAYVAIKNADVVNETRVEPNSGLRNKLITIEQMITELLENNRKYSDEYITLNNIEIGRAVQASCSYPGIFCPVNFKNKKLDLPNQI